MSDGLADAAARDQVLADQRRDQVAAAVRIWSGQLIDLTGRNQLLYYRDLKVGTLDLADAVPEAMIIIAATLDLNFAKETCGSCCQRRRVSRRRRMRLSAKWGARLAALTVAVVATFGITVPAGASANNVVETNYLVGGAETTSCSGSLSSSQFTVPNSGDWLFVEMGAKTTTAVSTPIDSMGNTFTLVKSVSAGGSRTGRWFGVWRTQASSSGTDTVSWSCDGSYMSGGVIGTFTATGTNHQLTLDTFATQSAQGSFTDAITTSRRTGSANEFVIHAGYAREGVLPRGGTTSLEGGYVNGVGQTSGTWYADFNTQSVDPTWSRGSSPSDTVAFGDPRFTCNPSCRPYNAYYASMILTFSSR
jgi:hypothetical protein